YPVTGASHHQDSIARLEHCRCRSTRLLVFAYMACDRTLPSIISNFRPRQPQSVTGTDTLGQFVEVATAQLMITWHRERVYALAASQRFGENLETSFGERGCQVFQLHPEAHVGLVDAEALHRFFVSQPRERRTQFHAKDLAVNRRHHAL